ncbi:MAG: glycosyltransferase family 4 protein [Acidobacteriota bacterium]
MRILLDYRPALRQRTGVGEYVHELARALVATAPEGEFLSLFSSSWKDRLDRSAVPGADHVDRRVPVRVLNFAWHRLAWPPAERLVHEPLDVVHAAHPLLIPSSRAAQVVTVHDLDFLDHPDRTHAEIRRDYGALARSHVRRADQVVAVSHHTASEVERRFGIDRSRISVCRPGRPDWPAREAEPVSGCVLFLGTLEPRKNLDVLLDAYERLIVRRSAHSTNVDGIPSLVLAGRVTPEGEDIVARTRRPPFAGRVEVPGYIDTGRRRALYDNALAFVLPSHAEGFGMTALEAMTVGVPVIAANRGALPEVVGDAGRLFDPQDSEALAHHLQDVLADTLLRARMRDAGLARSRQFTWRDTARGVREAWMLSLAHRRERRG